MSLSPDQFELLHAIRWECDKKAMSLMPLHESAEELLRRGLILALADDELAYVMITDAGRRALAS